MVIRILNSSAQSGCRCMYLLTVTRGMLMRRQTSATVVTVGSLGMSRTAAQSWGLLLCAILTHLLVQLLELGHQGLQLLRQFHDLRAQRVIGHWSKCQASQPRPAAIPHLGTYRCTRSDSVGHESDFDRNPIASH